MGHDRPWDLDVLPLIIAPDEWQELEAGTKTNRNEVSTVHITIKNVLLQLAALTDNQKIPHRLRRGVSLID